MTKFLDIENSLKIRKLKIKNYSHGQATLYVLLILATVLVSTLLIIGGAKLYFQNSNYALLSEKATALAEAGIDKAIVSLNKTGGSYAGETETAFGEGTITVKITNKDAITKKIETTGYIPNKAKAKSKRTVQILVSRGIGAAFNYGVQVGEGGWQLGNNNTVQGSVYSNGNIQAGSGNQITGDVYVAGGPQPTADQQTDCVSSNCQDFLFGKVINSSSILDVAQSFQSTQSNFLNKISLKIKKFGSPPDITVRLLGDSGGKPNKNDVKASGTLYSTLVTGTYGWIDVTFSTIPSIVANTPYWLVLDTASDTNNYWSWQNDASQGYNLGQPKWAPDWGSGNPTWNTISGDLSFKTYLGGTSTSISASNINMTVGGNVHAHSITNLTITGGAYYQSLNNSTAGSLHPGSADPAPQVFPISEANIAEWKQQAISYNPNLGNPVCGSTWGPGKYNGNAIIDSNCTIIVKCPIWITGNLTFNNNNIIKLDSSFGATSGTMVVEGITTLGNSNQLEGTGQEGSLLWLISTYDSRTNGVASIDVTNTGNSGIFYTNYGIIQPGNGNTYKELTAWGIRLANNTTLIYETGLASTLFTSGPSGSYSIVKGTYTEK